MKNHIVNHLANAARRKDWTYVDRAIPKAVNIESCRYWAYKIALKDPDVNVRDAGASLLEKAYIGPKEFATIKPVLIKAMRADANNYAGFRAACALAAHGVHDEEIKTTLQEFSKDKEVGTIAKNYLMNMASN